MKARRLRAAVLLIAFAGAAWFAAGMLRQWWTVRGAELFRVDYTLYYASALQGLRFGWHRLYDLDAQRQVFRSISPDLWWFPINFTPPMPMLMVPFTFLSLDHGYRIWSALQLGALALSCVLLTRGDAVQRGLLFALALLPYPMVLCLRMGQVIPLQVAALAVSFALLQRGHEKSAGFALAAIALKPQGMLLVPFALLVAGKKKAFSAWVAAMAALGVIVLLVIGLDGARDYLRRVAYAGSHPDEFWVGWWYTLPMHFTGLLRPLVQALAAVGALLAARRHRDQLAIVVAAGLLGSLLSSPFLHLDDLILLVPAGWLVLRVAPQAWPALLVGYVLLFLCTDSGTAVWGQWVLWYECAWLATLCLWPRRREAMAVQGALR